MIAESQQLPTDAADYAELQKRMRALKIDQPDFETLFPEIGGKMEEIKNRNNGYAPGTEPK